MAIQDSRKKPVVGEVYSSLTGNTLAEKIEYNIGWLQTSKNERVKVVCKRISHSYLVWQKAKEADD